MSGRDKPPIPFRRRPSPTHRQEFARMMRKLADERAAAASGTIEKILETTPVDQWSELVEHPDLRTYGALERLGRIFVDTLATAPQRAHVLALLGVSLTENLSSAAYAPETIAQAKAYAWKDLGTALRFLGRPQESIDALLTAEAALTQPHGGAGSLTHDRAIVRFSLAVTYQEADRFQESRALLAECKEVFREHGDDRRYTLSVFAEGVLLQRLQHYREAREIYLLLLASTTTIEKDSLAAVHRVIGLCSIELADFREAETHLRRSIALNDALGQRLEALKGKAALGRLFIRRGDAGRAVLHLRPVRHEFLRNGLTEEAGICGLEVVEGLLQLEHPSQAETLARTIVSEFTAAKLNKQALLALDHLAEAIAARKASTSS
jgi:tetratricopeptide (TPR) repeat protein